MKFTVLINDEKYEIEVSKQHHEIVPTKVRINGEEIPIRVSNEWDHEFPKTIIIGNTPYEAEFEYGEDGFPKRIWLNGSPGDVRIDFLGKEKLSKLKGPAYYMEEAASAIICPMPGKIVKMLVKENQVIKAGSLCIILEAMKMENELEAPCDAIVKKIYVKEGDSVEIDQILISFVDRDEIPY